MSSSTSLIRANTNYSDPNTLKNESPKRKIIGFAIAIIVSIGSFAALEVGLGIYMGAISGLSQVQAMVVAITGGIGGTVLLIVGIVGLVKNCPSKNKAQNKIDKNRLNKTIPQQSQEVKPISVRPKPAPVKPILRPSSKLQKSVQASKVVKQVEVQFSDNATLYNRTAAKVTIANCEVVEPDHGNVIFNYDGIFLNGKRILFSRSLTSGLVFGRKANTDEVIVENTEKAGVYKIIENQTNGLPQKQWIVDTNKKFKYSLFNIQLQRQVTLEDVYLVEEEVPENFSALASEEIISDWGSEFLADGAHNYQCLMKA